MVTCGWKLTEAIWVCKLGSVFCFRFVSQKGKWIKYNLSNDQYCVLWYFGHVIQACLFQVGSTLPWLIGADNSPSKIWSKRAYLSILRRSNNSHRNEMTGNKYRSFNLTKIFCNGINFWQIIFFLFGLSWPLFLYSRLFDAYTIQLKAKKSAED